MKKVAISQSNYIPWKGYFDLIASVDEFILFDDVQYTRRDWRNRNKIKTPKGLQWLTIPVEVKGKFSQAIKETKVNDEAWNEKHWASIRHNYRRAPFYEEFSTFFEDLYLSQPMPLYLSEINFRFLSAICKLLEIQTNITWSMDYGVIEGKTERLIDLCRKARATEYWSGPAAKDYFDSELARDEGIQIVWMDYSNYPTYPQLYDGFEHGVSIIDGIMNIGTGIREHFKSKIPL